MTFPTQVNVVPAIGVAGDFASSNPRVSVINQQGAFVAGAGGVNVGLFAWADAVFNRTVLNAGVGAPTGFVAREQQAMIITYLAENGTTIQPGMPVTLYSAGDFFVANAGAGAVTIGMKAFASLTTGAIQFAATGAAIAGSIETKWVARTFAGIGELVKMSSHQLG